MPLDPAARAFMDQIIASGATPRYLLPPVEARKMVLETFIAYAGEYEPVASVRSLSIPGPEGDLEALVITPDGEGPFPVLVYFHGGGWTFANKETHEGACRSLANESGCMVVSVDYRLAPESKFPAAAEDCYTATQWVANNAASLNVDPARLAVGGDSAGGNTAAAVCLMARDRHGPTIAFQLLVYPVLDYYKPGTPSYTEHATGYFLTREAMVKYWENYLADEADIASPYCCPLKAEDLSGLPPALVMLAQYDPLYDEGLLYAERLEAAGVPVELQIIEGMMHGFWGQNGLLPQAKEAQRDAGQVLRKALS